MRKDAFCRLCAGVLILGFLSGCSMLGTSPNSYDLMQEGMSEAAQSGRVYGHGTGETEALARQAALQDLGQGVFVQVRSQMEDIRTSSLRLEGQQRVQQESSDFTASSVVYSNVELEGARVEVRQRGSDGWYVRMSMEEAMMDRLRQEVNRSAGLLAYLEILRTTDTQFPGRRLRYALQGLAEAERIEMTQNRIRGEGYHNQTYGAYFEQQIRSAMRQLMILPEIEGQQVRFILLDQQSLEPQPGIAIQINNQQLQTNSQGVTGRISLRQLGQRFSPIVLGFRESLGATGLDREVLTLGEWAVRDLTHPSETLIYVRSVPTGATVSLNGYTARTTPALFRVEPSKEYELRFHATDDYAERQIRVSAQGAYRYISEVLQQRHYGEVALEVSAGGVLGLGASGFVYDLRHNGSALVSERSSPLHQRADIGEYEVEIYHANRREDYQVLRDRFTLHENTRIERRYRAPIYRQPFAHGRALTLSIGYGAELGDEFMVPGFDDEEMRYGDFREMSGRLDDEDGEYRFESNQSVSVRLNSYRFYDRMSFVLAGSIGARMLNFDVTRMDPETCTTWRACPSSPDDARLNGYGGSLGAGFWTSKFGQASYITANMAFEHNTWISSKAVPLNARSVTNTYPFIELGVQGQLYGLGARVMLGDMGGSEVFISLGSTRVQTGYRHSRSVRAQAGQHY